MNQAIGGSSAANLADAVGDLAVVAAALAGEDDVVGGRRAPRSR
jgi:hypothetical protein